MFRSSLRSGVSAGLAAALLAATALPVVAQEDRGPPGQGQPAPPQKKKHHNSGVGMAIGAGVLGGLVGGALLGGQGQAAPGYPPQPGYDPPPPPRYGPPPSAYDAEADDEPVCHLVRRPVYDEDGQVVDYRTRRVCR